MFIVRPTLTDEEVSGVVEHAKGIVTSGGGQVVNSELLGRRRLAYEIDGLTDGIYGLMYFHASQEVIQDLRREFQLSTDVIRAMVVRANERAMALRATAPADAEAPAELEGAEVLAPEAPPVEAEEAAPEAETEPDAHGDAAAQEPADDETA
jgi:small subunit ribosomal protein S6